jgi:hypothetical protein
VVVVVVVGADDGIIFDVRTSVFVGSGLASVVTTGTVLTGWGTNGVFGTSGVDGAEPALVFTLALVTTSGCEVVDTTLEATGLVLLLDGASLLTDEASNEVEADDGAICLTEAETGSLALDVVGTLLLSPFTTAGVVCLLPTEGTTDDTLLALVAIAEKDFDGSTAGTVAVSLMTGFLEWDTFVELV